MKLFGLIALTCFTGCYDTSTIVNIAPSAHHIGPTIQEAVDKLNEVTGNAYTVRYAPSEKRIDNQIIVRHYEFKRQRIVGNCYKNHKGVIVRLSNYANSMHVAHELLHSIGLEHVQEPNNLMNPTPADWNLNEFQLEILYNL